MAETAYLKGKKAFTEGKGKPSNPYKGDVSSQSFLSWCEGYEQMANTGRKTLSRYNYTQSDKTTWDENTQTWNPA